MKFQLQALEQLVTASGVDAFNELVNEIVDLQKAQA
jgi:hypothetical protein